MTPKVCLITGVGDGTGAALVERFIEGGYQVAMLARSDDRIAKVSDRFAAAHAYPCDVSDADWRKLVASGDGWDGGLDRKTPHSINKIGRMKCQIKKEAASIGKDMGAFSRSQLIMSLRRMRLFRR